MKNVINQLRDEDNLRLDFKIFGKTRQKFVARCFEFRNKRRESFYFLAKSEKFSANFTSNVLKNYFYKNSVKKILFLTFILYI